VKRVLMSDTHGRHGDCKVPEGDVFVHAGDFSPWVGTLEEAAVFNEFWAGFSMRTNSCAAVLPKTLDR
jgi:hypothetical protein